VASMRFLQKVNAASHFCCGVGFASLPGKSSELCGSRPMQRREFTSSTRASNLEKKDVMVVSEQQLWVQDPVTAAARVAYLAFVVDGGQGVKQNNDDDKDFLL
jgi:hypothetical protein